MSELRTYVCDICGEPLPAELVAKDLGIWFWGGSIGIPHVCPTCQEKTTIAEARRRLKIGLDHVGPALREFTPRDGRSEAARRRRRRP